MPRGRKKKEDITLEQQLENIATEIANKEAELKELKAKQKELKKQLEAQKVNELLAIVEEKGMSIQEAIDLFADKKEENNEQ
ncbi:flagellar export protein FliJ [Clostridium sp. MCC344]|nr:flagellar export protein FliJ [Clostridium sp. MCC344]MBT9788642.1 flagellar export protein FliJ [Clostridium sp. MCC344]